MEKKPALTKFDGYKNLTVADQCKLYKEINGCDMPNKTKTVAQKRETKQNAEAAEVLATQPVGLVVPQGDIISNILSL